MSKSELLNISPVDGRYAGKTECLSEYLSEYALIKYRVKVEIEYFIALCELPLNELKEFPVEKLGQLRSVYQNFTLEDADAVKNIEKTTNHDVKAVEYFIKEKFQQLEVQKYSEFIHFGLTSQDINNTANPMMIMDAVNNEMIPGFQKIESVLSKLSTLWGTVPMLSRTHGQPATPTTVGKEIKVFRERLAIQLDNVSSLAFSGKFGGATGNFNAHHCAYPDINWVKFANQFLLSKLQLNRQQTTTQIEHYDQLASLFHQMMRINTILIDLCRDIWTYISFDYFKQKINKNEVGSSAMPHKVNPIDFENAEGNLGVANAVFSYLADKLPVSRLQRDLTDSTVLRNAGVPFAHQMIAIQSILKGLDKLIINEEKIHQDLENNWAVVAEAIQTILRKNGYPKPYEALKELTRSNVKVSEETMKTFIEGLKLDEKVKNDLKNISPFNYLGFSNISSE